MNILNALKIDGDIKSNITYKDGVKTEEFIYRNNNIIRAINYENGIETFSYEYEYQDSNLIFKCRRYKGVLDGYMILYHNDDTIKIKYKNGEII